MTATPAALDLRTPLCAGPRLRILRLQYCLSLPAVAERACLPIPYLSRMERGLLSGGVPGPEIVHRILDAIGATPDEREEVLRAGPLFG